MTALIPAAHNTSHFELASRALVRRHLGEWDAAILDAKEVPSSYYAHTPALTQIYIKSLKIQPSFIGYIAKSVALVGKGEKAAGYRACDIAFEHFHASHVSFLLLIKVSKILIGNPPLIARSA